MIVSPFTPIFFIDRKSDGIDCDYIQTFATTDRILLQFIGSGNMDVVAQILTEPDGKLHSYINFNQWQINNDTRLVFASISLSPGIYSINVLSGGMRSEPFRVIDNELELSKTTLIQYSMHNNRQRDDAIFLIDNMQYFFDFRVPGGFKDSNWTFGVENEQFVTDKSDIIQLFALDSIQQKFTLGTSQGCPVWFAALLNRLLCCTYVYFDGVRYARKDASVPEMTVQMDGVNSFVFTQTLQKVLNIDPEIEERNRLMMRRIDSINYRLTDSDINRKI